MNKKELLLISVGVFLTVIAWLIADIHHAATEEKLKTKVELPTVKTYDVNTSILQILKNKAE